MSVSEQETRLLVREIIQVAPEDIEEATATSIKIKNRSFLRVMKRADMTKHIFMFIHSHPEAFINHSQKDDEEEQKLFRTAYNRIKTPGVHASLVLSAAEKPICRVWLEDGSTQPVSLIRVIGSKFRFFPNLTTDVPLPIFFDRQVKAFGEDIQKVLQTLHVGIVGAGGTGSSVIEQLTRLGVGAMTIIDGQTFEQTNVNRVYGSTTNDDGVEKTVIAENNVHRIGLGTRVHIDNKPITYQSSAQKLKDCDVVFGCTDDQWGRSILNRLAVNYHIPVFDMGVKIDSDDGTIRSIEGRVTTLLGDNACLFCRERINARRIQAESLNELDPERLIELQKEGYADELDTTAPSVIPFTTNVASLAISEFLHRLTGFMGEDRKTNEIIVKFEDNIIRRNSRPSRQECFCGDPVYQLRGDASEFLNIVWRPE
jgi:molybdopterin/thiamine biosynthesis adenylyltransferase